MKQCDPQPVLEFADLMADRGGIDMELLRRRAEIEVPSRRFESADRVEGWKLSHDAMSVIWMNFIHPWLKTRPWPSVGAGHSWVGP
jgi:hypothetical protein